MAFAFSSILYPPENSVFVASDKLKIIRPLLDSVGFTLLCRLVVFFPLGAVFSAVDTVFTRLVEARPTSPSTSLLGGACQPGLARR